MRSASPIKKFGRIAIGITTLLVVAPMCGEITGPGETRQYTLDYVGPMLGRTASNLKYAVVTVGVKTTPNVRVLIGETPQPNIRYAFRSSGGKDIFTISPDGASFTAKRLGTDTLIVELVGATIDSAGQAVSRDIIEVTAIAKSVSVTVPNSGNIGALRDTVSLVASLRGANDSLAVGRVEWFSENPAIVSVVDPLGAQTVNANGEPTFTGRIVSVSQGTTNVFTVIQGVDTVRTSVTVLQQLSSVAFATSPSFPLIPTIGAIGDSIQIIATALDSRGVSLTNQPAMTFVSNKPAELLVRATTGYAVALDNTDGTNGTNPPAEIRVVINGVQQASKIDVEVKQVATAVFITSQPSITIPAPTADTVFKAQATDRRGVPMRPEGTVWSSSNPAVAQINSSTGLLLASAVGTTTISARRDTITTSVPVIVDDIPASLAILPDPLAILSVGATGDLTSTARNVKNFVVAGAPVGWTSLTPGVATVASATPTTATVTGVSAGVARIVGTTVRGGAADTVSVNVSNFPVSITLPASGILASRHDTLLIAPVTIRNSVGDTLPRTSIKWESEFPAFARVGLTNDGTIIAVDRGETRIFAKHPVDGTVLGTFNVNVTNAPAVVALNRADDVLTSFSQTLSYTAEIFNARGALTGDAVVWRSTNQAVASIGSNSGLATAIGNGETLIIGEIGNGAALRADTARLVVSNSAVSLTVSPSAASITSVGSTQQLVASATNNVGGPVAVTVAWTSSDPAVATVSAAGVVTAAAVGTATISATASGLTATSTITVTNLPSTIDIIPTLITLASVNDVNVPAVDLRNAVGTVLPRTAATWISDDPLIALVTSDGTITAKAPGSTKIRATNSTNAAIRDSVTVTVSNAPATMTLSPGTAQTLTSLGQTVTLTATVLNAAGQPISNPTVVWEVVGDTTVVSAVTSGVGTGLVTALAEGTRTVRATSGTVVTTVSFTVAQEVSPSRTTIVAAPTAMTADGASTSTITLQLRDANGNAYVATPPSIALTTTLGTLTTATHNGSGNYTATLTAGTVSGGATISATAGAVGITNTALVTFTPAAGSQYLVTSTSLTPTAGSTVTISAQLADVNGNRVATAGRTVTWTNTGGGCFASGPCVGSTSSLTDATGVATITFTTNATATGHVVTATDNSSITGASAQITGTAATATKYLVTAATTAPAAGAAVTITAQLSDANNNAVGTSGVTVNWTVTPGAGAGTLSGASSTTDASGRATIALNTAVVSGTGATVTATTGALTGVTGTVTTVPGPATKLRMITEPSTPVVAGAVFGTQPVVEITDANNNRVTSDNATIVTASRAAGIGALAGTLTATAANGLVTFSGLNHPTASTISIVFGSGSLAAVTSANIVVNASTASAAAQTSASVPAGTAGGSTLIIVQARDANGNLRTTGGDVVAAAVTGANVANLAIGSGITDNGNGTYSIAYTPTAVGSDAIAITLGGAAIGGSPYASVVGAGAHANFLIEAAGGGLIGAQTAGTPFSVRITARDANGNTKTTFTGSADISSVTGTITGGAFTTGSFVNGVLTTSLTITNSGSHTLTAATSGGGPATTSGAFNVSTSAASLTTSTVVSNQAARTAGQTASITVQLRDANSNPLTASGGTIGLTTNIGTLSTVTNNNDGTYTAIFTATTVGTATIAATLNGAPLSSAPSIVVTPGAASTARSTIAVSDASIAANGVTTSTVTVQAKDAQGNNLTASGGIVTISTNAGTFTGVEVDNGNGTYTRTLQSSTTAGIATITATIGGSAITTASPTVTFTPGAPSLANSTITLLPAGPTVTVGTAVTVTVTLRDANNNPLTSGGSTVVIARSGTGSLTTTTDNANGTYTSTLNSAVLGSATLSATVGGSAITSGNPVITYTGGTATQIAENGGNNQSAVAGSAVATNPSVVVRDANGNPVSGVSVTFTVTGGGGSVTGGAQTTNASGIATVGGWTLGATVGTNTLEATSGSLAGSPILFTATGFVGAASAATSTITSNVGAVSSGGTASITVQLKDANNNNLSTNGGAVLLTPTSGSITGLAFAGSGAWTATFTASASGAVTINGTINGAAIVDDAVITVSPGSNQTISINGGNSQSAAAGSPVAIAPSVIVRDAATNPVPGVSVDFAVTGGGGSTNPASIATVVTNASGIASLTSWTLGSTAGPNTLTATSTGLTGSPITFTATGVAGAAATATSQVTTAAGSVTAGGSTTITVQLRDASSNPLTSSGGSVTLQTTLGTIGPVSDNADGTYTATLSTTTSGTATITGRINGSLITDNAVVTVSVAGATASQSVATVPPGTAGALTTVIIQARDAQGNNLTAGGAAVDVTVSGANTVAQFAATDNGNGTYTATYTPTVAGTDALTIRLGGAPIGGSPYSSVVSAGALNNFFVEQSGGGAIGSQVAGASFSIRITARDASGNTVTTFSGGANTIDLTSTGALTGAPITTAAFVNGVLTRSVTITNTGTFTLTATRTVGGTPSTASSSFVVASNVASAATTLITAAPASVTGGTASTITVQTRDAQNNPLTTSAGTVTLATTLGSLSGVTNNGNGTYSATLSTSTAGSATITGTINGAAIVDNEVVTVTIGVAAGATTQITTAAASITANNSSTTITVQAKDAQGNNLATSGGALVLNTSLGSITGQTDNTNGTYTATLNSATATGTATVTGSIGGNAITDNAVVAFVAGPATVAQSTISVTSNAVTVGTAVTVTVQLRDVNSNNLATAGGTVLISRTGTGAITATTNNGDGTYTATLNSAIVGSAVISATLGGSAITSGNQTVTFSSDAATQVALNGGDAQSATAGTAVATNPSVVVRDANGNPVGGVSVTFAVGSGGGSLTSGSQTTNASGIATVGSWTLGSATGANTLTATSGTLSGSPVTFSATSVLGATTANGASNILSSSFSANWTATSGATSYRLDVATDIGFTSMVSGFSDLTVAGLTQAVTGLTTGATYFYRVRPFSGSAGANSNVISVATLAAPVATAATAVGATSFTATWTAYSGATNYELDVATAADFLSGMVLTAQSTGNVTTFPVSGLSTGTTYYYRVRAIVGGNTTASSNVITVLAAPIAPASPAATSVTTSGFTATWSAATGAASYRLDVSTESGFTTGLVAGYQDLTVSGTSQAVTGLATGTAYFFRVRAVNATGTSANSSTVSLITTTAAPVASAATALTTTTFVANWAVATGAASYELDVSTASDFSALVAGFNPLAVAGGSTTSQSVTGLSAGTTYFFRVRAVNANGPSASSNGVTVLTIPAAPTAPTATSVTATGFTANWTGSTGAASYRLDVSTENTFTTGMVAGYQDLTVAGTSQVVTGLSSGNTHFFRVRAVNATGTSANSATSATVLSGPTATAATAVNGANFTARWNAVTSATGYRLDVSTDPAFGSFVSGFQDLSVAGTNHSVSTGVAATTFYYRVRAIVGGNPTPSSNVITVTTFTVNAIGNTTVAENAAYTGVTPALTGATSGAVVYTLGGGDAGAFTINASTGVVSMVARNFESPVDANADNIYSLTITATDGEGHTDVEDWTVTVTNVNEVSALTVGTIGSTTVAENQAFTLTANYTGTAQGAVTWTLGGVDAGLFSINPATGVVSMIPRNFEAPADAGANNVYDVTVTVTDADANADTEIFTVTVTNVAGETAALSLSAATVTTVAENAAYSEPAPTLTGAPQGAVVYTLGGADASRFTVVSGTGAVSMIARNFEAPVDFDANNAYEVSLIGTDADGNVATRSWTVTVDERQRSVGPDGRHDRGDDGGREPGLHADGELHRHRAGCGDVDAGRRRRRALLDQSGDGCDLDDPAELRGAGRCRGEQRL